jgi:hypothetical protein
MVLICFIQSGKNRKGKGVASVAVVAGVSFRFQMFILSHLNRVKNKRIRADEDEDAEGEDDEGGAKEVRS